MLNADEGFPVEMTPEQRQQLQQFAPDHLSAIERMDREAKRQARRAKAAPAEAPEAATFTVDISHLSTQLTVGEAELVEEKAGIGILEVFQNMRTAKVSGMAALVWVLRRREDPRYAYKDAQAMSLDQLMQTVRRESAQEEVDDEGPLEQSSVPAA